MKLKELKNCKDGNRFCGPAVISFITGLTTGESAALVRHQTGRRMVTGTYTYEVRRALADCGYSLSGFYARDEEGRELRNPTLAGWLKATVKDRTPGKVYLVLAGNHWQLVTGRRYACGRVGKLVSIKDERVKRRARVQGVWQVIERVSGPDRKPVAPAKVKEVREMLGQHKKARVRVASSNAQSKREAEKRLGKWGFSFERERVDADLTHIYVNRPDWFEDAEAAQQEWIDDTISHDWDECLDRVVPMFEEWIDKFVKLGYGPKERAA